MTSSSSADDMQTLQNLVVEMRVALQQQGAEIQRLQQQQLSVPDFSSPTSRVGASSPTTRFQSVVDTRVLGKPETFKGEPSKYRDWIFILKSYLGAIDSRFPELLEKVEGSDVAMYNATLTQDEVDLSSQLYYILVMLLRDRPLDRMHDVGIGEGLEGYRQLSLEYEPKVQSRFVGLLMSILSFSFDGDIPAKISEFERKIKDYEQQSSQSITDDIKYGVLIMGVTDLQVKQHLVRNAQRLDSWGKARDELLEISRTQKYLQETPQPMQLGATPWKTGKGKDTKGKDQKGKGKSKDGKGKDPKGKGKGEKPKDRVCFYCQKSGHVKADCRKRMRDLKEAEKGKGKTNASLVEPEPSSPPQPQPAAALPLAEDLRYIAGLPFEDDPYIIASLSQTRIMVDSGSGAHVFPTNFDEHAISVHGECARLATITGAPVPMSSKKQSVLRTTTGESTTMSYSESDKVMYPVLSSSEAASNGMWSIFGPSCQYLLADEFANELKVALENTKKLGLVKDRGVYWLPISPTQSDEQTGYLAAGAKAANKTFVLDPASRGA